MEPIKVAAIQMVSGSNLEQNLASAKNLIEQASAAGARLVVLPENFVMFSASKFLDIASVEEQEHSIHNFLSENAKKNNLSLFAGSIPTLAPEKGKVFSSCQVFSAEGKKVASYNKIHLFDVEVEDGTGQYLESKNIKPGEDIVVVEIGALKVGVAICYDLRFPEMFRKMHDAGVNVIVLPSAFTEVTGAMHWEVLLRARAVENFCYVLGANQGGSHILESGAERKTFGGSMIIDPRGKILSKIDKGEGFVTGEVDLDFLEKVRQQMPSLAHRRV